MHVSREERREVLEESGGPGKDGTEGPEEERMEVGGREQGKERGKEGERRGTGEGLGSRGRAWLPKKEYARSKRAKARAKMTEEKKAVREGRLTLGDVDAAARRRAETRRTQEANRAVKKARREMQRATPPSRVAGGGSKGGCGGWRRGAGPRRRSGRR